jgi:hypothetical protein
VGGGKERTRVEENDGSLIGMYEKVIMNPFKNCKKENKRGVGARDKKK